MLNREKDINKNNINQHYMKNVILNAYKALNNHYNGECKAFDTERNGGKSGLIDRLLSDFNDNHITLCALNDMESNACDPEQWDFFNSQFNYLNSGNKEQEQEQPQPQAQPQEIETQGEQDNQDVSEIVSDLEKTLRKHLGKKPGVDIDQVKQIVVNEVNTRFEKLELPTRTIYQPKESKAREVEGAAHPALEKVIKKLKLGFNVMLVGPTGCGKTYLAKQTAQALDLPFASVSCSEGMSESNLMGRLLPINGSGFQYIQTPFIDIYENGGLFLMDEMDACDHNVLFALNQALENGGFSNDLRHEKPHVKRHDNANIMAACNTFGRGGDSQYLRNRLDAATIERFKSAIIQMDYDNSLEKQLVESDILEWGEELRKVCAHHGIEQPVSTRSLIKMTKEFDSGEKIKNITKDFFVTWSSDELNKVPASLK